VRKVAEEGELIMYLIILHELDAAELFVNPDHIVKCHLNTEELELWFLGE